MTRGGIAPARTAVLLEASRAVYIEVPKVACSSMWDRLVSCYRDKVLGEAPDFTTFHPQRGVAYCMAHVAAFRAAMSFVEFVEAVTAIPDEEADEHFRSQYTFLSNRDGQIAIDFVGRFETLERDFAAVCRQFGLPSTKLPRVQAARTRVNYADYYDSDMRAAVARRYADDVRLFGYTFQK